MSKGTTDIGYVSKNRQTVLRKTNRPSSHHNQTIFDLKCGACGETYGANGSDIWLRKCTSCQAGKPSSEAK